MSTDVLKSDDLEAGMFVTVLNGRKPIETAPDPQAGGAQLVQVLSSMTCAPEYYANIKGDALKIVALDIPYVAVRNLSCPKWPTISLDTRCCQLRRLNKDYVRGLDNRSLWKKLVDWLGGR